MQWNTILRQGDLNFRYFYWTLVCLKIINLIEMDDSNSKKSLIGEWKDSDRY